LSTVGVASTMTDMGPTPSEIVLEKEGVGAAAQITTLPSLLKSPSGRDVVRRRSDSAPARASASTTGVPVSCPPPVPLPSSCLPGPRLRPVGVHQSMTAFALSRARDDTPFLMKLDVSRLGAPKAPEDRRSVGRDESDNRPKCGGRH
jgi:hypothetical protein